MELLQKEFGHMEENYLILRKYLQAENPEVRIFVYMKENGVVLEILYKHFFIIMVTYVYMYIGEWGWGDFGQGLFRKSICKSSLS